MLTKGLTIFVAGAYGTGKSTLCEKLSTQIGIPSFSAGDLISEVNNEQYGANKAVSDKNQNQILLIEKVQMLNKEHGKIILAGHFCIFDSKNDVEHLPEFVFFNLNLAQIVLLEVDLLDIKAHLRVRDGREYSNDSLSRLIEAERKQSEVVARKLQCPLSVYKMTFSEIDSNNVSKLIIGRENS